MEGCPVKKRHGGRRIIGYALAAGLVLAAWAVYTVNAQGPLVIEAEIGVEADAEVAEILGQARQLDDDGRPFAALEKYQDVIERFPGTPRAAEAHLAIGDIELHHGASPRRALEAYRKVTEDHPERPEAATAKVGQATALLDLREEGAYELFVSAAEDHPGTAAASRAGVWRTFLEVPQGLLTHEEAIAQYRQTIADTDDTLTEAHARYAIVASYYWMDRKADAIRELDELITSGLYDSPRDGAIMLDMMAMLYNWSGDYERAREYGQRLVDEYPKSYIIKRGEMMVAYTTKMIAKEAR